MNHRYIARLALVSSTATSFSIAACGGSDAADAPDAPDGGVPDGSVKESCDPSYPVNVLTTGLSGSVTLVNNGEDALTLSPSAKSGKFPLTLCAGSGYDVTVKTQPTEPRQTCTVASGKGTMTAGPATVSVNCLGPHKLIGLVSGAEGKGLVLQSNLGEELAIGMDDDSKEFEFTKHLVPGDTYSVTVKTQPTDPWQTCSVTNGTGTIQNQDVFVLVDCDTNQYKVKGTITGLEGELEVTANGSSGVLVWPGTATAFEIPLSSNSDYAITVFKQPTSPAQNCTVTNGTGKVTNADVSNVSIVCQSLSFPIKLRAKDLPAGGLVVQNGNDVITINADGDHDFPTQIKSGSSYSVSLVTAPAGGTSCKFYGPTSGTVGAESPLVFYGCGKPKRAFITADSWAGGDLGGLAGADAKCQSDATKANLTGTFKAWLSDDSGSPSTRFTRAYQDYVLTDGALIAHGYAGLTSGSLAHALDRTASGNGFPLQMVYTNTKPDGTISGATPCANWTSKATSAATQLAGWRDSTTSTWTAHIDINLCNYAASLYCFEQ